MALELLDLLKPALRVCLPEQDCPVSRTEPPWPLSTWHRRAWPSASTIKSRTIPFSEPKAGHPRPGKKATELTEPPWENFRTCPSDSGLPNLWREGHRMSPTVAISVGVSHCGTPVREGRPRGNAGPLACNRGGCIVTSSVLAASIGHVVAPIIALSI